MESKWTKNQSNLWYVAKRRGQCTRRPERVVRTGESGGDVWGGSTAGCGGVSGGGAGSGGVAARGVPSAWRPGVEDGFSSMNAGLSRSTLTVTLLPCWSSTKYLGFLRVTLKGPRYGGCRGFCTWSWRMNTCVQSSKIFGMYDLTVCRRVPAGDRLAIWRLSLCT